MSMPGGNKLDLLTAAERRVLASVAEGNKNLAVACELGIAEGTVKCHLRNIFQKLGVGTRTQAARLLVATSATVPPDSNSSQDLTAR